jgi:serine/threonine-protein kinase
MVGRIFLGRYETLRLLGEGGMGRVYLARQVDLGRQVVVKVMHEHIAADAKFRERFQRETLVMARFQHPYVVTLYDASLNDPEGPCIVMEYVRGVTLDTLLHRNGRLSPQRVCRLLNHLCEALQAAHAEGIVHRDLKPANLMVVDPETPYEKIKVMDFGLAKCMPRRSRHGSREYHSDTGADFAVGTPGYISPEQVRGDSFDHRADLYSVGVILYELLTGQLPFTGTETMDVLLKHAQEMPPTFADKGVSAMISPAVEEVVFACLAKNPEERPQSARELAEMYETSLLQELGRTALSSHTPAPVQRQNPAQLPSKPADLLTSTPIPGDAADQDPTAVVHHLQAWMPETIAAYKVRGFVDYVGGQVVESVPGCIRVRLGDRGTMYALPGGPLSWFGLRRQSGAIDIEMRLERNNPNQQNQLFITVIMRPANRRLVVSPQWRARCNEILCELRGHLMASGLGTSG